MTRNDEASARAPDGWGIYKILSKWQAVDERSADRAGLRRVTIETAIKDAERIEAGHAVPGLDTKKCRICGPKPVGDFAKHSNTCRRCVSDGHNGQRKRQADRDAESMAMAEAVIREMRERLGMS
jgi:hypothetical protein